MYEVNMMERVSVPLNIRVREQLKNDLQQLAEYAGLTVSSYVTSVLVRRIRQEKENTPEAFKVNKNRGGIRISEITLAKEPKKSRTG